MYPFVTFVIVNVWDYFFRRTALKKPYLNTSTQGGEKK
jgi:hypothetical protein